MRHRKKNLKLGGTRDMDNKRSLVRNLVSQLLMYERIYTTLPKARFARSLAERSITYAKKEDEREAIRLLKKVVFNKEASMKAIEVLRTRYKDRNGGYTRIIKSGFRDGDGAPMAYLELVK